MVNPDANPGENQNLSDTAEHQCGFWDDDLVDSAPPPKRGKRAYVGTKNNPTPEDIVAAQKFGREKCTYFVMGLEWGKLEETPHLQMYMEFKEAKPFKFVHDNCFRCWLAGRQGRPKEAAGYCKKGNSVPPHGKGYDYFFPRTMENPENWKEPFECGTITAQGKRTDIDMPVEALVHEGAKLKDIAREYPTAFVKYHKGFAALRSHMLEPRMLDKMPEVIWRWGLTGTGKTECAYYDYDAIPHYVWGPANGGWWDRYDGEDKIILDEFRGQMPMGTLLMILDRYECMLPYKGGFVNVRASKFVITSPKPPDQIYADTDSHDKTDQLMRRITKVVHHLGGPLDRYRG